MELKGKRVVVIGGAGLIGSHAVDQLTREDAREFLAVAPLVPVKTSTTVYKLEAANEAIADLRAGAFQGAAVLVP